MKQTAYIFDVDGVLNDLKYYIPDERVIGHMVRLLRDGAFVAINTGRGYAWIEENVVRAVQRQLGDSDTIDRFFVAVEMGGLGVEFKDGVASHIKSAFSLTQEQIDMVHEILLAHPEFSHVMGWYAKESMATLDKHDDTPLDEFVPLQKEMTSILAKAFEGQHVKVANSTDAIDVHSPEAGKWAGAELIYEWLRTNSDVRHDHFVCFGDSGADYEMARFFAGQSYDTIFVCTNPALQLPAAASNITVFRPALPYNDGANEYLEKVQKCEQ